MYAAIGKKNKLIKGDIMKLIANNYTTNEIFRIVREWSGLSRKEFAKKLHRSETSIQSYELGRRKYNFETLVEIANEFDIKVIIEK